MEIKTMGFILICGLAFIAAVVGIGAVRFLGWPYWSYHVLVITIGCVLYVLSSSLMMWYIRKNAPEYESFEEVMPGVQKWELTAGAGIVPKWVSFIGIVANGGIPLTQVPPRYSVFLHGKLPAHAYG
ncbi:MAG: hypothetical protein ACOCX4_04355, partial [Planctomycetota bacterium]